MNIQRLFLAFTFIAACTRPAVAAPSALYGRSIVEQMTSAVAMQATCIVEENGEPGVSEGSIGTGVIIDRHHVLTANHVIDDGACTYAAIDWHGNVHKLKIERVSKEFDLARLVTTDDLEFDPKTFAIGPDPKAGDKVCPIGMIPFVSRYCGDALWQGTPDEFGLRHSALVQPGNSGGPVYDAHGRLIAITTRYYRLPNGQIGGGRATLLADKLKLIL